MERVWFEHRVGGRSRSELGIPPSVDASFRLADADTTQTIQVDYANARGG